MSTCIRPGPREVMELQRRCHEEFQPYIDLMVREMSLNTRIACIVRADGTLEWMHPEETGTMKHLRANVDAICKKYAALAIGDDISAQNTAKPENM